MVDDAVLTLRALDQHHLLDNLWNRYGMRPNSSGARTAAQRSHTAEDHLGLFAGEQRDVLLHWNQRRTADHHWTGLGEVERNDRDVLQVDVLPDVEFRPVGERKNADAFAFVDPSVEQIPELRPLVFRVPLPKGVAERIHALLCSGLLLVAARTTESSVVLALFQSIEQGTCLEQTAALLRPQTKRGGALLDCLPVRMHLQFHADRGAETVAELDHFAEFVGGVNVEEWKGDRSRVKGFLSEP